MRKFNALAMASVFVCSPALSQGTTCKTQTDTLSEVTKRYASIYEGYQKDGEDLKQESGTFISGDITWENTSIIFDTPTVTVKDQKLIFGVPQVTIKQQDIVFGTPSIRMKRIKSGQYPETTCRDTWISAFGIKTKGIPACTVSWSDIFIDVPEPFLEQQKISMGIPEFKWDNTEVVIGVPEFGMQRQKWIMGLPQFTVNAAGINSGPLRDKAATLQNKVADTQENQQRESISSVSALYSCYRDGVEASRKDASAMFNASTAQLDGVITALKSQGADPSSVSGPGGSNSDLLASRANLVAQRDKAMSIFDAALEKLDASEKEAVQKMKLKPSPTT